MKKIKKLLSLALACVILLSAVACSEQEAATTTAESVPETATTVSDEEAIAQYIQRIKDGYYQDKKLFNYEDLSLYFVPGEYRGISYPTDAAISTEISDAAVEIFMKMVVLNNCIEESAFSTLTEGTVEMYDTVTMNYKGYVDGMLLDKATQDGAQVVIGSKSLIDGFEDGLIGKKIGEEAVLNLRFSPYFSDSAFAGKDVVFHATVTEIERAAFPDITVEMINSLYSSNFESLDAVKVAMKTDLENERVQKSYEAIVSFLQKKIIAGSTVLELPEKELAYYSERFVSNYQQAAAQSGKELEAFCTAELGLSLEEFYAQAERYARESALTDLLVHTVAEKEALTYTDEEISEFIHSCFDSSEEFTDINSMIAYYAEVMGPYYFVDNVLWGKVCSVIFDSAVKSES